MLTIGRFSTFCKAFLPILNMSDFKDHFEQKLTLEMNKSGPKSNDKYNLRKTYEIMRLGEDDISSSGCERVKMIV